MSLSTNDRPRPVTNLAGSRMPTPDDTTATLPPNTSAQAGSVRCRRCGHLLVATRSVRVGMGPTCRRLAHLGAA